MSFQKSPGQRGRVHFHMFLESHKSQGGLSQAGLWKDKRPTKESIEVQSDSILDVSTADLSPNKGESTI